MATPKQTRERAEVRTALAVLRHLSAVASILEVTEPRAARDVLRLGLRDLLTTLK